MNYIHTIIKPTATWAADSYTISICPGTIIVPFKWHPFPDFFNIINKLSV